MENKTSLEKNKLETFIIIDDEFNPVYCRTTGTFEAWSTLIPRNSKGSKTYEAMDFSLNDAGDLNITCRGFSRVDDFYVEAYGRGFLRVGDFYRKTLQSSITLRNPDMEKLKAFTDNPNFQGLRELLENLGDKSPW